MARIAVELHVEMEDGTTYDVVADQREVSKWEVQDFGTPFPEIGERMHLGLRWLAWSALSRRGELPAVDGKPMSWEQFDALCVEASDPVDVDEQGDPDPGQPAPSEESSSSSPGAPGSR